MGENNTAKDIGNTLETVSTQSIHQKVQESEYIMGIDVSMIVEKHSSKDIGSTISKIIDITDFLERDKLVFISHGDTNPTYRNQDLNATQKVVAYFNMEGSYQGVEAKAHEIKQTINDKYFLQSGDERIPTRIGIVAVKPTEEERKVAPNSQYPLVIHTVDHMLISSVEKDRVEIHSSTEK